MEDNEVIAFIFQNLGHISKISFLLILNIGISLYYLSGRADRFLFGKDITYEEFVRKGIEYNVKRYRILVTVTVFLLTSQGWIYFLVEMIWGTPSRNILILWGIVLVLVMVALNIIEKRWAVQSEAEKEQSWKKVEKEIPAIVSEIKKEEKQKREEERHNRAMRKWYIIGGVISLSLIVFMTIDPLSFESFLSYLPEVCQFKAIVLYPFILIIFLGYIYDKIRNKNI